MTDPRIRAALERDAQAKEIRRLRAILNRAEVLADAGVELSLASGRKTDAKYLRALQLFLQKANRPKGKAPK